MIKINLSFIPLLYVGFAVSFLVAFAVVYFIRRSRREKRNPLSKNILRGPGESIRLKLDNLDEAINDHLLSLILIPSIVAWVGFYSLSVQGRNASLYTFIMYILLIAIPLAIISVRLFRLLNERHNYRLGLDAELAVGRELNLLMREEFHVFHDFPEEKNNIDHIVVGPSGVFAIETKGRAKPDKGRGQVDAKVVYDGQYLIFPDDKKTSAPIIQAKKQAKTLASWLSSAIGEPVKVEPVLALPGWFVTRKKPNLAILYGQKKDYLLALKRKEILSDSIISRIVHQLEQKCRDVKPSAYLKG